MTEATQGSIHWDADDGVVTLTFDAPGASANTMDAGYVTSMEAMVERLEQERPRGVILTSAKKTFFAGGNIDELGQASGADAALIAGRIEQVKRQLRRLETLGVPVVAAINGAALGGGLEIALACHHRVVLDAPKTRLGLPEVTLGILPGAGGVVRSVRLLGLQQALTGLLLQGQRLTPHQALELGLVHEVVDTGEELLARARAFIEANPDARQPWDVKGYRVPGGTPANPSVAAMLPLLTPMLSRQLKGAAYPAPHAILAVAVESLQVDVDTAFIIEGRYFLHLLAHRTSSSIIGAVWTDKNAVDRGASRPADEPTWRPERVGVVGAGMMGAGIAHSFAVAGASVTLLDTTIEAAEKGKAHAASLLDKQVSAGRRTAEERDEVLTRITTSAQIADLAGCDLVIEAVFEDATLKHRILVEVAAVLGPDALLTSNTSTLPIAGLSQALPDPAEFVGMHFFSPVHRMALVEVIAAEHTSPRAVARAFDAVRMLGKTPIVVSDSRGFFTSRVFGTFVMEGAAMLAEGVAPMTIERAALQAGFPVGPLSVHDEVTLSLTLRIDGESRTEPGYVEHPGMGVVRALVEAGRSGKSTGGGFFDWTPTKRLWPGLGDVVESRPDAVPFAEAPSEGVPFEDVQERLLFVMAVETARCLDEGVLHSVADANVGSILGIGFPPLHGGALAYIDSYEGGVAGFVARADALADAYGERFRPPALLRERAVAAGSLRAVA